jgi:ABC-2 type transport system ATP-binding protein
MNSLNPEILLEINGLTKQFGKVRAVNGLNLKIHKGSIYGLLGPNGSGKTTTLGMILGVINPTSGHYSWFGEGNGHKLRLRIGAILEQPNFYHYLSGYQNLKIVARIKGVPYSRIHPVLERVSLAERKDDPFHSFSLGMKQRLAIASALLADPEVLILDEPTNGLDPKGIAEMRALILDLGAEGRTIILASHLLDEVERICSHFTVLNRGHNIYSGSVSEALSGKNKLEVSSEDLPALAEALRDMALVQSFKMEADRIKIQLKENVSLPEFHKALIDRNQVLSLLKPTNNLEEKFLEILNSEK